MRPPATDLTHMPARSDGGKVAVITGGGRGIGRAVARYLAEAGASVTVVSRSSAELGESVDAIRLAGGDAEAVAADLTDAAECDRVVREVWDRRGRIDVLVHCAGFTPPVTPMEETSVDAYERTMATNVGALFHLSRTLVPRMKARGGGLLIAMSSGCGLKGHPGMAAYSASKFAVQGLIQAIARELDGTEVRAFAINPGGVDTKMLADLFGPEEARRNQSPDVVAEVVRRVVEGTLAVPSGGGVTVRRDEVAVYEMPGRKPSP